MSLGGKKKKKEQEWYHGQSLLYNIYHRGESEWVIFHQLTEACRGQDLRREDCIYLGVLDKQRRRMP